MRDALAKVDRPIFFSMCEWGVDAPWYWAAVRAFKVEVYLVLILVF